MFIVQKECLVKSQINRVGLQPVVPPVYQLGSRNLLYCNVLGHQVLILNIGIIVANDDSSVVFLREVFHFEINLVY